MIGQPPSGRGWTLATLLSLAVHGAAAGLLLWQPDLRWHSAAPAEPLPQMQITALPPPGEAQAQPVPAPRLIPDEAEPGPVAGTPDAVPQTASPVLTNTALPVAGTLAPEPVTPIADAPLPDPQSAAPEADPRLVEIMARIRSDLTAPCLLALPMADGSQLDLLTDDDSRIPAMVQNLTQGLDGDISAQPILVDPRQCAALTFARADPRYPAFPVVIRPQSRDLASGDDLRGTVLGSEGLHLTLLLIDDNGVTHDLRRFLVNAGGRVRFDLPVARNGEGRDTHQLLLAIATPTRPATISDMAGELAEDVFDRLSQEIGPDSRIGVSSVYVRAKS